MGRKLGAALSVLHFLLAGCAQLPPTPQDLQAKLFEPVPGKSVVYIMRPMPDWNPEPATILLDEKASITTYPGTYYRWEVDPGPHRIAGFAGDNGVISLQTEPDRIYYVQQRILPFFPFTTSYFQPVTEPAGRAVVMRSTLLR